MQNKQQEGSRQSSKKDNQTTDSKNKMATPTYSTSTQLIILLMATYSASILSLQTNAQTSCKCFEGNVEFSTCNKNGQAGYRKHTDRDIGLTGSCLPEVPVNTMKCFKMRTATGCAEPNGFRCLMKRRSKQVKEEQLLVEGPHRQSVTIYSPGHNKTNPFYLNRNFCIYNISLDCPGQMVSLNSKPNTLPFSDAEDYLWFDTSSNGRERTVNGSDIIDFNDSTDETSFLAVLWTNGNNSSGRFEVEARCNMIPAGGSGDSASPIKSYY